MGETAGLLEMGLSSDIFMTTLGNIPAGAKLLVRITYVGELKHDMGASGIRFTLPTFISPRYGEGQPQGNVSGGGIAVTVDINLPQQCSIEEVRSPSHPIALTLGSTSVGQLESKSASKASATLSLGTAALDKDFVLEVKHKDDGEPRALLETHDDILGQRGQYSNCFALEDWPYSQSDTDTEICFSRYDDPCAKDGSHRTIETRIDHCRRPKRKHEGRAYQDFDICS